ncbi:hypothetical protein Lal_00031339, partial [Lupinus albus]
SNLGSMTYPIWRRMVETQGIKFSRVSNIDNVILIFDFTKEEIKEDVWSCGSSNQTYNFKFIKKFWHLMQDDVLDIFKDFHNNSRIETLGAECYSYEVYSLTFLTSLSLPGVNISSSFLDGMVEFLNCSRWTWPMKFLGIHMGVNHRRETSVGRTGPNNKICWAKWELVCTDRTTDGLGVKQIDSFNLALLVEAKKSCNVLIEIPKISIPVVQVYAT